MNVRGKISGKAIRLCKFKKVWKACQMRPRKKIRAKTIQTDWEQLSQIRFGVGLIEELSEA
jgi:hypothetical protein